MIETFKMLGLEHLNIFIYGERKYEEVEKLFKSC